MRVGFIGLGNMGSAMARNLIKSGHELVLYNRTRSRAEELQPLGGRQRADLNPRVVSCYIHLWLPKVCRSTREVWQPV